MSLQLIDGKIFYHQGLKISPYVVAGGAAAIEDKDMKMKMWDKGKSSHASLGDELPCLNLLANTDFCAHVCEVIVTRILSVQVL